MHGDIQRNNNEQLNSYLSSSGKEPGEYNPGKIGLGRGARCPHPLQYLFSDQNAIFPLFFMTQSNI